jgi:hypothetical protein
MGVSSDGIGPSWIRHLLLPIVMLATTEAAPCELSPDADSHGLDGALADMALV